MSSHSESPKILSFCPSAYGGIAEHTFYQASVLQKSGAKVTCLVAPTFLNGRETEFEKVVCLMNHVPAGGREITRMVKQGWRIIANYWIITWETVKRSPDLGLLDFYVEYLSPFWVWPHWILARLFGVKYAANLHDPVRNYTVGPEWWHQLSVRLAYLPLDFVVVHHQLSEPSPVPSRVRTIQAPVGVYEIEQSEHNPPTTPRQCTLPPHQKLF